MELDDEQLKRLMHADLEGSEEQDLREALEVVLLRYWEQEKQAYIDWWNDLGEEGQEEWKVIAEL